MARATDRPKTYFVSTPILVEYQEVLLRPRLRLNTDRVRYLLGVVHREASLISPVVSVGVSTDEADNRFLECAEKGEADFLITGNQRHVPACWKKTVVVTAREFLELVASGEI